MTRSDKAYLAGRILISLDPKTTVEEATRKAGFEYKMAAEALGLAGLTEEQAKARLEELRDG